MIVVEDEVKKTVYIVVTVLITTVGIDRDIGILVLFLIIVNTLIGFIAYRCCRRS